MRSVGLILIALLLLNEGLRYSQAWISVYLSARDAKSAIWEVVKVTPDARDAAALAAQAACAKHGTELETYGHELDRSAVGQRVTADLQVNRPVTGAILVPLSMTIGEHKAASTWKSQRPVVRYRWQQHFNRIE